MPDEPEEVLLERFTQGDQQAFESLFRQFETEVYRWIVRIVRDAASAEDVMVEAFWRAYRGRVGFEPSRSFGAWMRRIATNAALDHLRREQRRARWQTLEATIQAPGESDADLNQTIRLAFRRLPPKLQVVATLALIEGWPYAEIANSLDVPVGTVKSRMFHAVRTLRRELAKLGVQP